MKKSSIILSVVTALSIGWGIYSSVVTHKAIQERDKVLVETTAETMANVKDPNKTSYELWKEDKKKIDEKQEKQNLIFELEKTKKELESKHISTDVIEETIKLLSIEILEGSK